jgi:hypothetical protein
MNKPDFRKYCKGKGGTKSEEIVQAYTYLNNYYKIVDVKQLPRIRNLDKSDIK